MVPYLIRRLLLTVPVLFGMSVIVFSILRLTPGDPARIILGLRATPEALVAVRHDLGLDLPIHLQYLRWAGNMLSGDLGKDYNSGESINRLLQTRLPVTVELTALAMLMTIAVSIPLGTLAAARRGAAIDRAALGLGLLGISVPDFWLAIMLILGVSLGLDLLPSSGFVPLTDDPLGNLRSLFLPALTLAVGLSAVLTRMTRSSVLEVLSRDFVKLARAKGLRERVILFRHVLPNAAIPIITVIGLQLGYLLGGAVIVEQVFSLPGVGSLVVNATLARNYNVVQAGVLVVALLFVLVNLLTDVLYAYLDPTVRAR